MNLLEAQAFCVHKAASVVVVCGNENIILNSFLIMVPHLKHFHIANSLSSWVLYQDFPDVIFSKRKGYLMPLDQVVRNQLTKKSINSIA